MTSQHRMQRNRLESSKSLEMLEQLRRVYANPTSSTIEKTGKADRAREVGRPILATVTPTRYHDFECIKEGTCLKIKVHH